MEAFQQSTSHDEIKKARALVFMDDVQESLRKDQGVFDLTLEVQIVRHTYNDSMYVIARNRAGEEITSLSADNKGQHGHFVHPSNGTGTPKGVAGSLANDRKWFEKKRAEAAAKEGSK